MVQVLNRADGDGAFDSNAVSKLSKLATDAGVVLQATKLYREITGLHNMLSSRDGEDK